MKWKKDSNYTSFKSFIYLRQGVQVFLVLSFILQAAKQVFVWFGDLFVTQTLSEFLNSSKLALPCELILIGYFNCLETQNIVSNKVCQLKIVVLLHLSFAGYYFFDFFPQLSIFFHLLKILRLFLIRVLKQRWFLFLHFLPVYILEERVIFDFLTAIASQSFFKIRIHELFYQIFSLWTQVSLFIANIWPFNIVRKDVIKNFLNCVGTERSDSYQNFVDHDTKTPPVDSFIIDRLFIDDFRRYVVWSSNQLNFILFALSDFCFSF